MKKASSVPLFLMPENSLFHRQLGRPTWQGVFEKCKQLRIWVARLPNFWIDPFKNVILRGGLSYLEKVTAPFSFPFSFPPASRGLGPVILVLEEGVATRLAGAFHHHLCNPFRIDF